MFDKLLAKFNYQGLVEKIIEEVKGFRNNDKNLANGLIQTPMITLSELKLFKQLMPKECVDHISAWGLKGWYGLSFCLRFHVTWMNFFFSALQDRSLLKTASCWEDFFTVSKLDQAIYLEYLHAKFDKDNPQLLPILGFSPLGVHVKINAPGVCRAFDIGTIKACHKKAAGVYCELHGNETWWQVAPEKNNSTQAIMFQFYSQPENFYLYSQADLEGFVNNFWRKMRMFPIIEENELKKSLETFGLFDKEGLLKLGMGGLRKMFLQKSLKHHPDLGGEQECFVVLKSSYEILKHVIQQQD